MNWTKLLYVLIVILLYIPMVFLGANVFFPKYTGTEQFYQTGIDCYGKYPYPANYQLNDNASKAIREQQQACVEDYNTKQRAWEKEKNTYESWKYLFIVLFNLVILLIALFVKFQDSIIMGLFLGSTISTFAATIRYFDSNSKLGFGVLVVTFFVVLYFINRKKDTLVSWK